MQSSRDVEVFVALGSNQGGRIHYLNQAVASLAQLAVGPVETSAVYETDPVGYRDQPQFLNMVTRFFTSLSALQLLEQCQRVEAEAGRRREFPNGPRTLDVDLLLYGSGAICYKVLQVPHPRMWQRAFVMVPLAELSPGRRGLGGQTFQQIADRLSKDGVRYVGRFW